MTTTIDETTELSDIAALTVRDPDTNGTTSFFNLGGGRWRNEDGATVVTEEDLSLDIEQGNVSPGTMPHQRQVWASVDNRGYFHVVLRTDWRPSGASATAEPLVLCALVSRANIYAGMTTLRPSAMPGMPLTGPEPDWLPTVYAMGSEMADRLASYYGQVRRAETLATRVQELLEAQQRSEEEVLRSSRELLGHDLYRWMEGADLSLGAREALEDLMSTHSLPAPEVEVVVEVCVSGTCEAVLDEDEIDRLLPTGISPANGEWAVHLPFHTNLRVARTTKPGECACADVSDEDVRELLIERGLAIISDFEVLSKECDHCR